MLMNEFIEDACQNCTDVTRALTSFSVECCVKAGHSLQIFCRWEKAIQKTLSILQEK